MTILAECGCRQWGGHESGRRGRGLVQPAINVKKQRGCVGLGKHRPKPIPFLLENKPNYRFTGARGCFDTLHCRFIASVCVKDKEETML